MPSRIIRDSICTSPTLDALSDGAERLFWRLVTIADDYGRFEADPRIILGKCFPMKIGTLKPEKVADWFQEMVKVDLARQYRVNDRLYGYFPTWEKYQRIRAKESRYPPPPDDTRQPQESSDVSEMDELRTSADTCPHDAGTCQHVSVIRGHLLSNAADGMGYGEEGMGKRIEGMDPVIEGSLDPGSDRPPPESPDWPSEERLVQKFHAIVPSHIPRWQIISPVRQKKLKEYLRLFPLETFWDETLAEYAESDFLSGREPPKSGHSSFKPDLDWLLSKGKDGLENCIKVHDGKYRNRHPRGSPAAEYLSPTTIQNLANLEEYKRMKGIAHG